MSDLHIAHDDAAAGEAQPNSPVEQDRARQFSHVFRALMQRQNFYVPLTGSYLVVQLADRIRSAEGQGIHTNSLRAYLRGEVLPSDSKVRLLADALCVPRGALLYAAGYLTSEDLPNYPGPYATLDAIEADIREVESLPLSAPTKARVLADLESSARILRLIHAERAQAGWRTAPNEREQVLDLLIELWEAPAPPPPDYTANEAPIHGGQPVTAHPQPTPTNVPEVLVSDRTTSPVPTQAPAEPVLRHV